MTIDDLPPLPEPTERGEQMSDFPPSLFTAEQMHSYALSILASRQQEGERLRNALAIVHEQAEEEALWCIADNIVEAYFQQELRRLHYAIEGAEPSPPGQQEGRDSIRYKWLANRVLGCDYGDNDAPGEQIGWRIRHDLLSHNGQRQPAFMFGPSIDAAIDAAISAEGKS